LNIFLSGYLLRDIVGVLDPRMVDALEDINESLSHHLQISKGQVTFVELSVLDAILDQPINQFLSLFYGTRSIGPRSGLCLVSQHQNGSLAATRPGSRVSESLLVCLWRAVPLRTGLTVEVTRHGGPVVLRNEVLDLLGQTVLLGEL
jgi:hypothetical protein